MRPNRLISCLCTALLTISLVPSAALAQMTGSVVNLVQMSDTARTSIDELLARGSYVEGEAIVVVRGGSDVESDVESEDLATASADSVDLAVQSADGTEGVADDLVALRAQSIAADSYTIQLVVDHSRTTAEILADLYQDPNVVSAEPNYLCASSTASEDDSPVTEYEPSLGSGDIQDVPSSLDVQDGAHDEGSELSSNADEATGELQADGQAVETLVAQDDQTPAKAPEQPLTAQEAAVNPGDLTAQQWSLDDRLSTFTMPISPTAGYSMNVPGWFDGRNDSSAPANASGTVCIMDTGIDVTHPDLQGVLYDFEANLSPERFAELKATYGMGRYGLNASGDGSKDDVTGYHTHGIHVAGIVAAQWNGLGTSGIANGVKIFPVRIFGNDGNSQVASEVLKGFQFLVDVAKDVNLKAVNCSWGSAIPQFSYEVMINELGKRGVNVVFASGNRFADLDETIDSGGMSTSPYAITVNAAAPNGKITDFSCYGQASTDVFAPGAQILSTISQQVDIYAGFGDFISLSSRLIYKRFFPEATNPANILTLERFSGTPAVRIFATNPASDANATELTESVSTAMGYDDSACAAINVASLNKEDAAPSRFTGVNGYLYLAIPVSSVVDTKWIALKHAMSDSFKTSGQINAITCTDEDGKPIEVSTDASSMLKKGWNGGAGYTIYQCQWTPLSLNVDAMIEASNEAHEIIEQGGTVGEMTEAGQPDYTDPGKATGVYGWENNGSTYVIVKYAIGASAPGAAGPSTDTTLYLDNVAVGNAGSFVEAYEMMSGTSMAAPAVSGCLAVIAKDEPASATLSDAELELLARERKAKLLASVDYDDDLTGLCRTGARVNLHGQSTFTKKAPIITRATVQGDELTLEGFFFGSAGSLAIDGREVAASSWSDTQVKASVASLGLDNDTHVAKITNAEGAVMQMRFSYSNDSAAKLPLYERTHSVPVNDEAFIADDTDYFYGPMVYCGGSIYTISANGGYQNALALWCYNVESDSWKRCDLPEGYVADPTIENDSTVVENGCLFSYEGSVYLRGVDKLNDGASALWKFDSAGGTWSNVELQNGESWPQANLIAIGDKLFAYGIPGYYFDSDEGEDDGSEFPGDGTDFEPGPEDDGESEVTQYYFGLVDLEARTLTKAEGPLSDFAGFQAVDTGKAIVVSSQKHAYIYLPKAEEPEEYWLVRISYDAASNKMTYEDLTSSVREVIDSTLLPEFERGGGKDLLENHFTLAGLPDGVAIIGSPTVGEDTHIIKDGSTELVTYPRTSSYHQMFYAQATYGDGYLYALGNSATEPDVMYFRSTRYLQQETDPTPEPTPTPEPNPTPTPTPTPRDSTTPAKRTPSSTKAAASTATSAGMLPKTGDPTNGVATFALATLGLAVVALGIRMRSESR